MGVKPARTSSFAWALAVTGGALFFLACSSSADDAGSSPSTTGEEVDGGGSSSSSTSSGGSSSSSGGSSSSSGGSTSSSGGTKPPSFTDGIKNGNETDVDCGGPDPGPRCAEGKACKANTDCQSDGCAFDGKCASHPSCTKLEGGYTCGPNDAATKQADCCASAKVGTYTVDKYLVTAGRMRTFLDRLNGDVKTWATGLPANKWSQANTAGLPASWDEANTQLGPFYGKRSCETGYETGHTFWTPASYGDTKDLPQSVLDTKALNCVPWALLAAFCVWDGGHLATEAEILAAYKNNGTTAYPWGAIGDYTTSAANDKAIQLWAYETPNVPAGARTNPSTGAYLDAAIRIAPPGRRPMGYNATGHADLVGDLLEWVSDRDRQFIWKGSFENHAAEADLYTPATNDPFMARTPNPASPLAPGLAPGQPWQWGKNIGTGRADDTTGDVASMGYYGIGGRCARN